MISSNKKNTMLQIECCLKPEGQATEQNQHPSGLWKNWQI
jgi:hypothetical protein